MGNVYLDEHLACPFRTLDTLLKTPDLPKICIVDFHAEATGEKRAFGYYADGRVSAVFGTHTHVQTADETVLPKGTGYITDVGMTGPIESVLGVRAELVIKKQISKMPVRFDLRTARASSTAFCSISMKKQASPAAQSVSPCAKRDFCAVLPLFFPANYGIV